MVKVTVMWGSDLSQVSWRVKPSAQEVPGQRENGETICGDKLNTSSAFAGGFGRGVSYLMGLAGFDAFVPVAESASRADGVGMVYRGFLSAVRNNVQSMKASFIVVSP